MKVKSIVFCASAGVACIAMSLGALMLGGVFKANSVVKYAEKEVSLEFNASNLSNGSGTVTLNGNLFTYENLTVSGNAITLGYGSRIYANQNSGASVGANGLKGAGFSSIQFFGGLGGQAEGLLNGDAILVDVPSGASYTQIIESSAFDLSFTTDSIVVERMVLNYGCKLDQEPEHQKVLFVGSGGWGVGDWKDNYTELLPVLENGATPVCDHFTNGSFTFTQVGNLETNYAEQASLYREKLFSENWDAVVYQLSRRVTPSSTDFNAAELAMFKDVIVPLTRTVTSNITLMSVYPNSTTEIFDYDPVTGLSVETGVNETATVAEINEFVDETVVAWANAAGVKAGRYGKLYEFSDTVSTNSGTRSGAKRYCRALVTYATVNETHIPDNIGTLWVSSVFTSDSSGARTIKNNLGAKVNELTFG